MASAANTPSLAMLRRRRHALVLVLTFVTGCVDATGFLALGGAFSSIMTGNMVLLGLSAAHTEAALAINSGSAIISYVVGVLLGAHIAGAAVPSDPVWPRQVTRALTAESVVLLIFLLVWQVTLGHRSPDAALGLLMIAAAALGIQSSAIQRFGVSGLSSTYLTGTLTTLIGALAARSPRRTLLPNAQLLTALIAGAGVGALVVEHLPWLSPVLMIVQLIAVIALSTRLHARGI